MENLTKPISLKDLVYPVYLLSNIKPTVDNNKIFYTRITRVEDFNNYSYLVVDDKSIPEDTLSKRRLKLLISGVKLYKIKHSIFFLGDLLKLAKRNIWFIDSAGTLFNINKQKRVKLVCKKISKVLPISTGGAVIEIDGIPERFKSLYCPGPEIKYAGILIDGFNLIFYGFYTDEFKTSYRLI